MMVKDGDVSSASNYTSVRGVLQAVGKRVQVYVASEDVGQVDPRVLKDLVATFDDRIFPVATKSFGLASDVDGDGRFTVLMSSWLSRLGDGRHAVDGFVRVADLDAAYPPPFGNRCDMMYLSTALRSGPHLRTVMAHEYTHAVTFSRKSLQGTAAERSSVEEEGWLDEGLSHLAEDLHGFSRSNIDYRVSAFLSQPERYQLVVDDYYSADLFRSHGNRGSTYLFLRWCADQFGPGLIPALIASRFRGIENLERATGSTFASLYRRWSISLFLSGLDPALTQATGGVYDFRSINVRAPFEDWELAGPRYSRLVSGGLADHWTAVGTSSHYTIVESARPGAVEIKVDGPPEAKLQVTAIPLPADLPRLELSARASIGQGGELRLRAGVRERQGTAVRLSGLTWEPLTPPPNPHTPGFRQGRLDMLGIASNFGTSSLSARGVLHSGPIRLPDVQPADGPLIVKLTGTDASGRRVAAWAEVETDQTKHRGTGGTQPLNIGVGDQARRDVGPRALVR